MYYNSLFHSNNTFDELWKTENFFLLFARPFCFVSLFVCMPKNKMKILKQMEKNKNVERQLAKRGKTTECRKSAVHTQQIHTGSKIEIENAEKNEGREREKNERGEKS